MTRNYVLPTSENRLVRNIQGEGKDFDKWYVKRYICFNAKTCFIIEEELSKSSRDFFLQNAPNLISLVRVFFVKQIGDFSFRFFGLQLRIHLNGERSELV